ncbi:MAG: helix-turn-helix domain-containing protein [Clostridia bacterium]|nr:helix-turn-helix domain-containing protein [Clostridia bacterium]
MAENVRFLQLWDTYRGLLTERQRQVTDLFFNYDFSLSEIASETGVSRQSVSECIHKCKKQLEEYEEKLGFFEATNELCLRLSIVLTKATKWIDRMKADHPELCEDLEALRQGLIEDAEAPLPKS